MSVLIKGMEMPETCRDCRLSTVIAFDKRPLCDALVQYMSYGEWETKRLDNCPLIPIPPHGRLGDLDRLEQMFVDIDEFDEFMQEQEPEPEEHLCHFCGGKLSEIRYDGDKKYRHCYSCHFDQYEL